MLIDFVMQSTHASLTHSLERLEKKITYGSGCNESEINLCIIGKVDSNCMKNFIAITGEMQHNLVLVDGGKKQRKKTE